MKETSSQLKKKAKTLTRKKENFLDRKITFSYVISVRCLSQANSTYMSKQSECIIQIECTRAGRFLLRRDAETYTFIRT